MLRDLLMLIRKTVRSTEGRHQFDPQHAIHRYRGVDRHSLSSSGFPLISFIDRGSEFVGQRIGLSRSWKSGGRVAKDFRTLRGEQTASSIALETLPRGSQRT